MLSGPSGTGESRLRIDGRVEYVLEVLERCLRFPVDVDNVPEFLQGTEYEERVDEQGEELAHRDLLREDEVQHDEQNRCAEEIDGCPLYEAQTAQVADFFQLQMEDLPGRAVEAVDLLPGQSEAFDELDIPQRLRRGPRQRGCFSNDHLLDRLDFPAQDAAQNAEKRDGGEVDGGDHPVDSERIDHYEYHPDKRRKKCADRGGDKPFDVNPDLLELAKRFTAPLVLEHRVRELQRMPEPI